MLRAEPTFLALRSLLLGACLLVGLVLAFAPTAKADDLADFEAARTLYERQNYAQAVTALRALVGSDPPRVGDPLLVLESRKYLGASLLFMGAAEDAKLQFRMLLTQEPRYTLDPLAFPTEVLALFDRVKADLQREIEARKAAEEAARRSADEKARGAEQARRHNLTLLRALAEQGEIRVENSRWIASVPFGVGQFQNGHKGLGVALAMAQGISAATSIVSYVAHERLADNRPSPGEVLAEQREENAWRTTNYVSFGVFVGLAIIGIVDAHVRFVPQRVTPRARPLPPELDRWVREQAVSSGFPVLRF